MPRCRTGARSRTPPPRSATSSSAISTIFFVQSLVDVVRIRFTFTRALTDTAIMAQIELLGCAEGKN